MSSAAVCLPIACVAAALAVAATSRTPYQAAGRWFVVALIGQASSLQLIDAGPSVHYQHFLPLSELVSVHPWLIAIIGLQAVLTGVGLARRLAERSISRVLLPKSRLAIALFLSVCTAATVSPDVTQYLVELMFASTLQLISICTIVVMVLALPREALVDFEGRLERLLGPESDVATAEPVRGDRFVWVLAVGVTLCAAVLCVFSYQRLPHIADEVSYLLQARYFAAGMLTMPAPPSAAAFDVDLMYYEPLRWFSPLSPGWPAMLAVGVKAGVPWLVNPVLAGLNVLLAYLLLGQLYPQRVARYATALLSVSPWFLFLGMSFMNHMLTLTCGLGAALSVVHARRTGTLAWGLLAGVAIGASSLLRQLDGVIVGVLMSLWAAGAGGARLKLAATAGLVVGTLAVGALVLPYNQRLTGSAFEFPVNAYFDKYYHVNANAYGFGPDRGMGWAIDPNPGHSPVDGLINTNLNAFGLNTDLFGWSVGSLFFVAWLLCAGSLNRSDRLMLATIVAVIVAYFFNYFSGGPDFGARYWFLVVVPLVALTARGIQTMERVAGPRVGVAVTALVAMALINFVPWRAIDKYHHYRGMGASVSGLAREHQFGRDLVLVRGDRFPDYASAVNENPIDMTSAATIYAWDRNSEVRAEVLRAYPDRRVWLVDGPTITGAGFRIADGPVTAAALLAGETPR